MATRTISDAGGNWGTSSTWVEEAVPTAADDVVATATSGNVVINTGGARRCRSLNLTGYVGDLSGSNTLQIGDGTAGAGNVALKLASGMTYSGSGAFAFVSTSATQQAIDTAGKTVAGVTLSGVGSSYALAANLTCAGLTLTNGTLDLAGFSLSCSLFTTNAGTKTLTLGSSTLTCSGAWNNAAPTNFTLTAGSHTIAMTNTATADNAFVGGDMTYNNVVFTTGGDGTALISGSNTFAAIQVTGGAAKTIKITAGTTQAITGNTPFPSGASGNIITFASSTGGSAWNLVVSKTASCDYLSLQDSAASGASCYAGANSTNVSGNTGWTFTPPVASLRRLQKRAVSLGIGL